MLDLRLRYWAYLYLLRVPLLTWLVVALLAPFALLGTGGPLLRGLLDLAPGPGGGEFGRVALAFGLVTLQALLAAAAIAVTARLVVLDGAARFGAGPVANTPGVKLTLRLVPALAALSIVGGTWAQSWPVPWSWTRFLGMLLGSGAGVLLFVLLATVVQDYLWRRLETRMRLAAGDPVTRVVKGFIGVVAAFARLSPAGYLDARDELRDRHVFAAFQMGISLVIYGLLWFFKYLFRAGQMPLVPPLCLALTLVILACFALAGLAFFLDRFHIPVLLVLVGYFAIAGFSMRADSFFQTQPLRAGHPPNCPVDQLLSRGPGGQGAADPRAPVVVIATTGGGIQAAAWTARVFAGLHEDTQNSTRRFDEAVRVVSSVSGGSVGALFMLDAYDQNGRLPPVAKLDEYAPLLGAEASALDEVGWGLVYPDLVFSLLPIARIGNSLLTSDRGAALERAWTTRLLRQPSRSRTLGAWRQDAVAGRRPAVIFNATMVETGQRLLLATTDQEPVASRTAVFCPDPATDLARVGRRDFRALYEDVDVDAATAARLSATFPFVSPATRILREGPHEPAYHVVDGGYYDNYGVATLVEWLDQAISSAMRSGTPLRPILLLELRSSAVGGVPRPDGRRGMLFQLTHPITTMIQVRGTGQLSHNELDAKLLEKVARLQSHVPIARVIFEFPAQDPEGTPLEPPLSWHLTAEDKQNLRRAWGAMANCRKAVEKLLRDFSATHEMMRCTG